MYVKEKRRITNKEYREINDISRQMVTIELSNLVKKEIFVRKGKAGKGIAYQLTKLANNLTRKCLFSVINVLGLGRKPPSVLDGILLSALPLSSLNN